MAQTIVVLDGRTLTPNVPDPEGSQGAGGGGGATQDPAEPTWHVMQALGQVRVYDRTEDAKIVERIGDAAIVLTNKTPLTADTIRAAPNLAYIGVLATGVNVVDLPAADEAGVVVANVPAYSLESVAQHVFALLLELTNHVAAHDRAVHEGDWSRSPDFSFTLSPLVELAGKTLGIVGLGAIGSRVAAIGDALGMKLLVHSRTRRPPTDDLHTRMTWCELDELFERSEVVTLHCPLTEQTRHMINAQRLTRMKPEAYLINTGRGDLIDEAALAAALHEGRLAGAGLDVLSEEPPSPDNPLLTAPRCVITPHIAWATREARCRLMDIAAGNIKAFLDGQPRNVVNHPARR